MFRHLQKLLYLWRLRVGLLVLENTPSRVHCLSIIPARSHDDVIKWKHFPRYWPFVRGIHRPPVNSPHKGQWRGALMFSLICVWINGWVNNREAGDLRCHRAHYDVIVMTWKRFQPMTEGVINVTFLSLAENVHLPEIKMAANISAG